MHFGAGTFFAWYGAVPGPKFLSLVRCGAGPKKNTWCASKIWNPGLDVYLSNQDVIIGCRGVWLFWQIRYFKCPCISQQNFFNGSFDWNLFYIIVWLEFCGIFHLCSFYFQCQIVRQPFDLKFIFTQVNSNVVYRVIWVSQGGGCRISEDASRQNYGCFRTHCYCTISGLSYRTLSAERRG